MRLFPAVWVPCETASHPTLQNFFPRKFQLARLSMLSYCPFDFREVYFGSNQFGEGFLQVGEIEMNPETARGQGRRLSILHCSGDYKGIFFDPRNSNPSGRDEIDWVLASAEKFKEYAGMPAHELLQVSTRLVQDDVKETFNRMPYFAHRYLGVLPSDMSDCQKGVLEGMLEQEGQGKRNARRITVRAIPRVLPHQDVQAGYALPYDSKKQLFESSLTQQV